MSELIEIDTRFHTALVALSGNIRAQEACASAWRHLNRVRYLAPPDPAEQARQLRDHHAILHTLRTGDALRLEDLLEEHWAGTDFKGAFERLNPHYRG